MEPETPKTLEIVVEVTVKEQHVWRSVEHGKANLTIALSEDVLSTGVPKMKEVLKSLVVCASVDYFAKQRAFDEAEKLAELEATQDGA